MSTFLFTATSGAGRELWRTDGTAGGTALVHDFGSLTGLNDVTDLGTAASPPWPETATEAPAIFGSPRAGGPATSC